MRKIVIPLFVALFMFACNTNDKENTPFASEVTQPQVVEVREDPINLLVEAKLYISRNDYLQGRQKLSILDRQFPHSAENVEGRSIMLLLNEEEAWQNALNSIETDATTNYIVDYPKGKYSALAKSRFNDLRSLKEKNDYEYALTQNSSSLWKKFLENYPSRSDIKETKSRIIRAEVDEIMSDQETGAIPPSDRVNSGYSSSSKVKIKNDTDCMLTVRYSGGDAKMIEIPVGETRSISLSSGSYRIAASACGYNYAGMENLQGSYSSSYYITTTRY
jgi:hypothetical protein